MSPMPADETGAVLNAATDCYLRLGVTKTTAADIARAAGISRATLYRRHGGKESIFLAVLERESEAMALEARAYLAPFADPAERLLESMMFSISQMSKSPMHAAVFTGESAAWAARRAIRMEEIRRISERGIRMIVRVAADSDAPETGTLSDNDITGLADWIMRILMSYALVPGPGDQQPADIRRQLALWFMPAIQHYLRSETGPLPWLAGHDVTVETDTGT